MEWEEETAESLLKPGDALELRNFTLSVSGIPKDSTVLSDMEHWLRNRLVGMNYELHAEFRDRIKNLGVKWV